MGSILFRLFVALALRAGLDPVDLKLLTAGSLFLALVFPQGLALVKSWGRKSWGRQGAYKEDGHA
jgi:putative ABC transport system permease protein